MKTLIISHNPISTVNNNGKTMLTLFSTFKEEELCQLYVAPAMPDVIKCKSYFRITDKDVLKSYYKFYVKGKEITSSDIDTNTHLQYESEKDEKLYRNVKNKKPVRALLRDMMWGGAHWYTKKLASWITSQNPTNIFVVPGSSIFLYKIALKIAKKFNLPIVTYVGDGYYFVKASKGLIAKLQQARLKKAISKLMAKSSHLVAICDELSSEYSNYFKIPTTTVMTGSYFDLSPKSKQMVVNQLFYMGNIRCKRYNSLAEIGRTIDIINNEFNTDFKLNIYTSEKDNSILKTFEGIQSITLRQFVSGEEFNKIFSSAPALVHVEDFDNDSVDLVKYSMSTKISDSLSSGVCLFAYGPSNVASISYLIRNDCAIVCTDKNLLKEQLVKVFFDHEIKEKAVQKALKLAHKNHQSRVVSTAVYNILSRNSK